MTKGVVVDEKFCFEEETQLTVHKTSMFFPGDGFLAYDPAGELLFRFDSYGPNPQPMDELALMDASGKCLLTLFRKKPSLHQRWEGVVGERSAGDQTKAAFSVRRSSIIGRSNVLVDIYGDEGEEYQIVGSFPRRCCAVYGNGESEKEAVVEIKRKVDTSTNVMLGKDVFLLCLSAGFDCAFAMGLVLVLDQMYGDDDIEDVEPGEHLGVWRT